MSTIATSLIPMLPRLRRYALALCRVSDIADDLVQVACEKALSSQRQTLDVSFDAWMFRILRNSWIDRLRRQRTRGEEIDIVEHSEIGAFDGTSIPENRLMLKQTMQAIGRLPAEQRERGVRVELRHVPVRCLGCVRRGRGGVATPRLLTGAGDHDQCCTEHDSGMAHQRGSPKPAGMRPPARLKLPKRLSVHWLVPFCVPTWLWRAL